MSEVAKIAVGDGFAVEVGEDPPAKLEAEIRRQLRDVDLDPVADAVLAA